MFLILIAFFSNSCKNNSKKDIPPTVDEIITKSIQYYNMENWGSFAGKFEIYSEMNNAKQEVTIDNKKSFFKINYVNDSVTIGVKNDKYFGEEKGKPIPEEDINKNNVISARNYWAYFLGIPAKLKDKGTKPNEKVEKTEHQNKTHWLVTVPYDTFTWKFFFDKETYVISKACFYVNEDITKGECIEFEKEFELNGSKFRMLQHWYHLDGEKINKDSIVGKSIY